MLPLLSKGRLEETILAGCRTSWIICSSALSITGKGVTHIHAVVRVETLNVEIGRVLVFERLVNNAVVLLTDQLGSLLRKK
jgi:hypothetical protein